MTAELFLVGYRIVTTVPSHLEAWKLFRFGLYFCVPRGAYIEGSLFLCCFLAASFSTVDFAPFHPHKPLGLVFKGFPREMIFEHFASCLALLETAVLL